MHVTSPNGRPSLAAMIAVYALRGAAGFFVGGLLGLAADVLGVIILGPMSIPAGLVLAGAAGSAALTIGRKDIHAVRASAIAAGSAMALPGIIVPLSVVSLEGKGLDVYGVCAWSAAFALAGAAVGVCLRWGRDIREFGKLAAMAAVGATAFALGGAVGGAVCFAFLAQPQGELWAPAAGVMAALLLGGTLTGAALGAVEAVSSLVRKPPASLGDIQKISPAGGGGFKNKKLSGEERLAVSAAALGIVALVVAAVYPLRFRLPLAVSLPLSIGSVSTQAAIMLTVLGAPALIAGAVVLRRTRRRGAPVMQIVPAWIGLIDGAALVLLAIVLLVGPAAGFFQARYAQTLLEDWQGRRDHWNYGNAMHQGHILLGQAALEKGDLAAAEEQLLLAADTPGSPQLASCGPDTRLAGELLPAGGGDAVLEYFRRCRRFWTQERGRLDEWRLAVYRHKMPDFAGRIAPGSLESVRSFVDAGGDVNAHDFFAARTVLHVAALYGHEDAVRYLLDRGADVNARDERGDTPLDLVADPAVAKLLAGRGGEP